MDGELNELIVKTIEQIVEITGFDTRPVKNIWEAGIEKNFPGETNEGELAAWAWLYVGGLRRRQNQPFTKERISIELKQLKKLFDIAIDENPGSLNEIHDLIKEFCKSAKKLTNQKRFMDFYRKNYAALKKPAATPDSQTKGTSKITKQEVTLNPDEDHSPPKVPEIYKKGPLIYRPPKPHQPHKPTVTRNPFKRFVLTSIVILAALLLFFALKESRINSTPQVETKTVTSLENYTEYISTQISFSEVLLTQSYDNQKVSLLGYLKREIESGKTSGRYVEYLIDDSGNKVELTQVPNTQLELFDSPNLEQIYNITGTLSKTYQTTKLAVDSITLSAKPTKPIVKQKSVNKEVVVPVVPTSELTILTKIRSFFSSILSDQNRIIWKHQACEDGTLHETCSINKPLYCNEGKIVSYPEKCGCPEVQRTYKDKCIPIIICSDETLDPECSTNKPYRCQHGQLIEDSQSCGCPDDYEKLGNTCKKIIPCSDGTKSGECGNIQPSYCQDGRIVERATLCGCPNDKEQDEESCVSKYLTNGKEIKLSYTLRGRRDNIKFTVYKGLSEHLASITRTVWYTDTPPTTRDFIDRAIEQSEQVNQIRELVEQVRAKTTLPDDQARIAISLVQNIPYNYEGLYGKDKQDRYPYEVLYDLRGVCGEKSQLLALVLRELDFGTAIIRFDQENHQAVGIKCPNAFDYLDSGYCFVESTQPTIITYSEGEYVGAGKLVTTPEIITMSDGKTFSSVSEEYNDAKRWDAITRLHSQVLPENLYYEWLSLVEKYGLAVSGK